MDAEQLFHQAALQSIAARPVCERRQFGAELAGAIGISQDPLAQPDALLAGLNRSRARDEGGKVELKLVLIARGVGTLDLAQLAFVAQVDDAVLGAGEVADVIALGVDRLEEPGNKGKVEAQPAAVADVEDAVDFDVEFGAFPVPGLVGIVGEGVGRSRFDSAHINWGFWSNLGYRSGGKIGFVM